MKAGMAESLLPTIAFGEAVAIDAVPGAATPAGGRRPPIADLSLEELRQVVQTLGQPAYRAEQVAGPRQCALGATGLMGPTRTLSSAEILEQALYFLRWTRAHPPVVRNVVFM